MAHTQKYYLNVSKDIVEDYVLGFITKRVSPFCLFADIENFLDRKKLFFIFTHI
jgi:hypothetical protein